MRTIFLILILGVLVLIGLIASGLININQTQPAKVPELSTTQNGVTATGGQAPAFEVETGTVTVGSKPANVQVRVPEVQINRPADNTVTNAQ